MFFSYISGSGNASFDRNFWKIRAAAMAVCLSAMPALAADHKWLPATGVWDLGTNWSNSVMPGGTPWETAAIMNGGTATVNTNVVPVSGELNEIWVGKDGGKGTVSVDEGGVLRSWQWIVVGRTPGSAVGHSGSRLLVNGGTTNAHVEAWRLEIGQAFNSGGVSTDAQMIMSGNSTATVYNRIVIGLGDFNKLGAMSDGTLTLKDNAILNQTGFSNDPNPFESDVLSVGETGWGATGTGNGNKGTLNVQDNAQLSTRGRLVIGHFEGASGTVNLSGNASITVDPNILDYGAVLMLGDFSPEAGIRSKGVFTQSGTSTFTIGNPVVRPFNAVIGNSGDGTYTLNGGTMTNWASTGLGLGIANINGNIGNGTLNLNGGTLLTASVQGGVGTSTVNFNGGKLQAIQDVPAFIATLTTANIQAGGAVIDSGGFAIGSAQNFTGVGAFTKTGAGTLTLSGTNTYAGATTVNAGTLVTTNGIKNNAALAISNDAVVEVPLSGAAAAVTAVSAVTIPANGANFSGKLELHDNDLIVNYGNNASPYATVLAMLKSGIPLLGLTGADGTGISSAEVQAQTVPGTMLGVVDGGAAGGLVTSLSGQTVVNPTQSVLVKYTWRGDANLDGVVNGSDYALADTGFSGGGSGWFYGDMNYDGVINGSDYALIDTGFSSQTGPLPEPAALSLLGLGAAAMLRRRRLR